MGTAACFRQENAIFSSLIHQTWPEPFSGALYLLEEKSVRAETSRCSVLNIVPEDVSGINDRAISAHTICVPRAFGNPSLCTAESGEGLGLLISFAFALRENFKTV